MIVPETYHVPFCATHAQTFFASETGLVLACVTLLLLLFLKLPSVCAPVKSPPSDLAREMYRP